MHVFYFYSQYFHEYEPQMALLQLVIKYCKIKESIILDGKGGICHHPAPRQNLCHAILHNGLWFLSALFLSL